MRLSSRRIRVQERGPVSGCYFLFSLIFLLHLESDIDNFLSQGVQQTGLVSKRKKSNGS